MGTCTSMVNADYYDVIISKPTKQKHAVYCTDSCWRLILLTLFSEMVISYSIFVLVEVKE